MNLSNEIAAAKLQDVQSSDIVGALQDLKGRSHANYEAEYGLRLDDGAFVMHFFPPGHALDQTAVWPDLMAFHDTLESALLVYFPVQAADKTLHASYVEDLKSFCVILAAKPAVPDFEAFLSAFFQRLEA